MATIRQKKKSKTIAEHSDQTIAEQSDQTIAGHSEQEMLVNDEVNQDRYVWYRYNLIRKRPALKGLIPAKRRTT